MSYYKMYQQSCGPWHHVPHHYKAWFKHPRREHGHLKDLILLALQEQPLNGYAIIQAIETKYGHAPGPAVVYPTLQLLEDQGYVNATEHENKKTYAVTEAGKEYLQENREKIDHFYANMGQFSWNSLPGIGKRVASLAGTIFANCAYLDETKTKQVEDLLDETRKRVGDIIFEHKTE